MAGADGPRFSISRSADCCHQWVGDIAIYIRTLLTIPTLLTNGAESNDALT